MKVNVISTHSSSADWMSRRVTNRRTVSQCLVRDGPVQHLQVVVPQQIVAAQGLDVLNLLVH
jgi:hypothetical protein